MLSAVLFSARAAVAGGMEVLFEGRDRSVLANHLGPLPAVPLFIGKLHKGNNVNKINQQQ